MKFGRDQKVEFKKPFKVYCRILLKGLSKNDLNLIHFAWTKVMANNKKINIAVA
jgi:hypothetical protein